MEYALTKDKKFIKAINARRSEHYFCPVCEEEMILCEGLKVSAYFRHNNGAECEKIIKSNHLYTNYNQNDDKPIGIITPKEPAAKEPENIKPGTLEELWEMNYRVAIFENTDSGSQFKIFDDNAKTGLTTKKWYGYMKSNKNKTYTKKSVEIYYSNEPKWILKWKLTHQEAEY